MKSRKHSYRNEVSDDDDDDDDGNKHLYSCHQSWSFLGEIYTWYGDMRLFISFDQQPYLERQHYVKSCAGYKTCRYK